MVVKLELMQIRERDFTETFLFTYHGLWARAIMSRTRFKAIMAMLHEDKSHKLRKVESLINDFKYRCLALYQPRQNLAINERVVK